MKWYWWAIIVILALNGLLIALIGAALALSRMRRNRAARADAKAVDGEAEKTTGVQ
jgi:hypothetical protein